MKAMVHSENTRHKGMLPSPVAGMDLGHWLALARTVEMELERTLGRTDLEILQRQKIAVLLMKVRDMLGDQLERINAPAPARP
jgi:hypothetical protein